MALTLDVDVTAEAISGDDFLCTVTDATTYGGGNPARAAGALYITGEKINSDGTVYADLVFASYDPETWSTTTFTLTRDGWHKFRIVFIRDYDSGTTYNKYEAVYNDSDNTVYRSVSNAPFSNQAPPNATYWEVVSDPTSLIDNDGTATESPNLEFQLLQRVLYPNAKVLFGNKAEDAAIEGYGDSTRGEDVLTYEFVRLCVEAMNSMDQRGKQADGERVARKVDEFAEA
jgi:hypothetical protein